MERNDNDNFDQRPPPYGQSGFDGRPPYYGPPEGLGQQPPHWQPGYGTNPPPHGQDAPIVKRQHTPSLVLSIIGLVFAFLFPLVTYPCSIISLVQSMKRSKSHDTKAAFAMSVLALPIAVINSIAGMIMGFMGIHPWF